MLQEVDEVVAVLWRAGDADTATEPVELVAHRVRILEDGGDLPDEALYNFAVLDHREQNNEFITPNPAHHVRGAHGTLQPCSKLDEELITDGMTKGVVHALEAVEIDEQEREVV